MRHLHIAFGRLALIAGLGLLAAGCGGEETRNTSGGNVLDANLIIGPPGKDASAMEMAVNAIEPTFDGNAAANATDLPGNRTGDDAGGNPTESNGL